MKSGVSADEKQIERKRRRWRRAISSSVRVTAFDQISLSPAIDERAVEADDHRPAAALVGAAQA